jgi:aminoglycoside phosphotransferase family enzyme
VDRAVLDRVERRASAYLADRDALLRRRIADGHIVDGHGDLVAEDIFCLPDRPRILDCLEFDDRLRHGDVLADIGFLAMDLERLGAPDEAAALLDDYRTESGSDHPASLAHLYVAYRAVVSTKIACLRHRRTGDPADAEQARQLLAIADRHLALGRVRLVLVGGLPGGSPERSART